MRLRQEPGARARRGAASSAPLGLARRAARPTERPGGPPKAPAGRSPGANAHQPRPPTPATQAAYDAASAALLAALERAEALLARRRFLVGDALTEADVRLFVTLIRFDPVYVAYFKCDMRAIREFPALRGYTADLFQTPGIRESVNVDHIRRHYWTSHPVLGPHAIISRGPAERWWEAPHGRGALGGAGAAGARAGGAA